MQSVGLIYTHTKEHTNMQRSTEIKIPSKDLEGQFKFPMKTVELFCIYMTLNKQNLAQRINIHSTEGNWAFIIVTLGNILGELESIF